MVEHIYFDYNILGKHPIEESGEYDNRYSHLNETIEKLLRTDVFKLVPSISSNESLEKV